ncbi:MAG: carbon monoxide dehydrogenase subunit G [Chloroflexota bacterium]|nr:carbon monoxide dehydrogenase subunit G [Chloroflexota bacterium]
MEVVGEYTFDAPQEVVWEALQDPDVLGSVMPGGQGVEEIGENEYEGSLKIKVGPVQGTFQGNIKLSDIVPPEGYTIEVDGKGAPGFVSGSGSLRLTGQDGKTHMTYEGTARVGGRIASVGQRLIESSARSIINQSLEGLNEYLKAQSVAQVAAETAPQAATESEMSDPAEQEAAKAVPEVEVPTYTAPSQASIAVNVAKDVASDLIPREYRPAVIAGVSFVLGAITYRFWRG